MLTRKILLILILTRFSNSWVRETVSTTRNIFTAMFRRNEKPFSEPIGLLDDTLVTGPWEEIKDHPCPLEHLRFFYYTDATREHPEEVRVNDIEKLKKLRKQCPHFVFTIHGFGGEHRNLCDRLIGDGYLLIDNKYCMFAVDWSVYSRAPWYTIAANNTKRVGICLGEFILALLGNTKDGHKITISGFSMGAHIAGAAGNHVKKSNCTVKNILGHDAAGAMFYGMNNGPVDMPHTLGKEDGENVMVMHTTSVPGAPQPLSKCDVYFNVPAFTQPVCLRRFNLFCGHYMSCKWFHDAIKKNKVFEATRCASWDGIGIDEFWRHENSTSKTVPIELGRVNRPCGVVCISLL